MVLNAWREGAYIPLAMCGRVTQKSNPLRLGIVDGLDVIDSRLAAVPPRYNGAPSHQLLVIRENHETGRRSLDLLAWGLIPSWCKDTKGGRKPINARAETIAELPTFRAAYRSRRCIVPVDNFFEWKALGGRKQPYAIGMKDGSPFALGGIWENWLNPETGEWMRTFAVITVAANELMGTIHDRMPLILPREAYLRWLGSEADPRDLLAQYPAEEMRMWPISTRVNSPRNDDEALLEPIDLAMVG